MDPVVRMAVRTEINRVPVKRLPQGPEPRQELLLRRRGNQLPVRDKRRHLPPRTDVREILADAGEPWALDRADPAAGTRWICSK